MSNLALNDALNMFADDLKKKGKSVNTIVAYKGDINQLAVFLSKKNVIFRIYKNNQSLTNNQQKLHRHVLSRQDLAYRSSF